jgi:hypothetical protein
LLALLLLPGWRQASAEDSLPATEQVAARLASPADRTAALLQMAVLARFQQRFMAGESGLTAETLAEDRAWLDRLQARFGQAMPRGTALDPAAWWVYLKLRQLDLPGSPMLDPSGPSLDMFLHQVFRRDDDRLAAALLPGLLWKLESEATARWSSLLEQAAADEALAAQISLFMADWPGGAGPERANAVSAPPAGAAEDMASMLAALAAQAVEAGPPDPLRLEKIRYLLLQATPGLEEDERYHAGAYLHLASLIDGLHEQRYTAFAEGLLTVVGGLVVDEGIDAKPVAAWLSAHLPEISAAYARNFASVDPRINSAMAAVFDIAQDMDADAEEARLAQPGAQLADSVAQLALLVPDIEYYFGLPVRDAIAGNVDACVGLLASRGPEGRSALTRELFDDCLESLVGLAETESRASSLSGDPDGPFGPAELQRELTVTSGQRLNYALGYLHERYSTACAEPAQPLPNPLEWSALATVLAWFAEQSPVYFQTPENEDRLVRMRAVGLELVETVAGQVDCFSGSGASLNDPVSRSLVDYRSALSRLRADLLEMVQAFRERVLAPGADIALEADSSQSTAYRPDDMLIRPCDAEQVCEMSGGLSSTRALLGLFPEPFLLADQSGMGEIELCYQNMEWVERRSEQVRPDDENVANYFGRFSFELKGRFLQDGEAQDVFGFRFTSPDEYHYLFAAASDEVLNDHCPMEWVGSRIVTPMRESRGGIVPNRLTYLAAPRMLPSRLLSLNWDRGAEWRDWFITGIGVAGLEPAEPPDIGPEVTQHLQALYRSEQTG